MKELHFPCLIFFFEPNLRRKGRKFMWADGDTLMFRDISPFSILIISRIKKDKNILLYAVGIALRICT
jgi:hypothetical protein